MSDDFIADKLDIIRSSVNQSVDHYLKVPTYISLDKVVEETAALCTLDHSLWVNCIVGRLGDWPDAIRPQPKEVVELCQHYASIDPVNVAAQKRLDENGPVAINAMELMATYQEYRPSVIDGLLRQGETMNIIAAPKVGKSWLVLALALSISNGNPWIGLETEKTNVLLVDNELHVETMAQRLRAVAMALSEAANGLSVLPLRGRSEDIMSCRQLIIDQAKQNKCGLIILDALYRFLPQGTSENDNSAMTALYNTIDGIAKETGASIILIHHSSKGNQADKGVTDGGAGAGAVSRAADAHVFLREHEEEHHVVFDCVARSWKPMDSFVIQAKFIEGAKVWLPATHMDPSLVKGRKEEKPTVSNKPVTVERLLKERLIPMSDTDYKVALADACTTLNATKAATEIAFKRAIQDGLAERFKADGAFFIRKTRN